MHRGAVRDASLSCIIFDGSWEATNLPLVVAQRGLRFASRDRAQTTSDSGEAYAYSRG